MCKGSFLLTLQAIFKVFQKIKPFKLYFQNTYYEKIFFSGKHVVPTKMI